MIYFDKDCEPANDIVVLKILDNDTLSSKNSRFVIGDESLRNLRVGFAKIIKIGSEAKVKTGLDVGSWVFFDKLSTFYHTEPIALIRYNGLIMESNEDKTAYRALGGRCIVQEVKKEDESNKFVLSNDEEMKILSAQMPGAKVNRYKGLGEMNPDQLWETTMNPANRVIVQIKIEDAERADEAFSILMGEQVEPRKQFIEKNAKYANLDV